MYYLGSLTIVGRVTDSALRLAIAASQFIRAAARAAESDASAATWRILALIDQRGPQRVSAIAAAERVARPTTTAVIQRMEGEGLVVRSPDPSDSRSSLIELAPRGADELAAWRSRLVHAVQPHIDALPAQERDTLARAIGLLTHITDSLEGAA